MPDRILASETAAQPVEPRRRRMRALGACAALTVALHLAFLDGIVGALEGSPEPAIAAMSVRTIAAEPEPVIDEAVVSSSRLPAVAPVPMPKPRAERRRREPAAVSAASPTAPEASASSADPQAGLPAVAESPTLATETATGPAIAAAEPDTSASLPPESALPSASSAIASDGASAPITFPGVGDEPPPIYRTQLPPPATLYYQVRRGFLRGDGEIRWQPGSDGYRLVLEARIAGVTLLVQTSEGAIDANGLAPIRFVDQRARRPAQAANFVRDAGRITFSGTATEWPLVAGSQDRLSWMIQLAGIVAAQPELLTEGGRITMAVVGARGDASIWTLRYVGIETVETANESVRAVKLVRDARSAYDTNAEIWLDPERSYLPAHATLRNSAGISEYDLLLRRVDR